MGFEGGQMPLYRRLPKRGFKNPTRKEYAEINLSALQRAVDGGKLDVAGPIDEAALKTAGLFKQRRDGVRLLATGKLSAKLTLHVTGASKMAVAAVEKAGGTVTVTGTKDAAAATPVEKAAKKELKKKPEIAQEEAPAKEPKKAPEKASKKEPEIAQKEEPAKEPKKAPKKAPKESGDKDE